MIKDILRCVVITFFLSAPFAANAQFSGLLKDIKSLGENLKQQPVPAPAPVPVPAPAPAPAPVAAPAPQDVAPSVIPKQFHGLWATQEGCRQMNTEGIDAPLAEVKSVEINLPFSSCRLNSVKSFNGKSMLGEFTCKGEEGNTVRRAIEISLNDASKLSVKGDSNLVNLSICKLKKS